MFFFVLVFFLVFFFGCRWCISTHKRRTPHLPPRVPSSTSTCCVPMARGWGTPSLNALRPSWTSTSAPAASAILGRVTSTSVFVVCLCVTSASLFVVCLRVTQMRGCLLFVCASPVRRYLFCLLFVVQVRRCVLFFCVSHKFVGVCCLSACHTSA